MEKMEKMCLFCLFLWASVAYAHGQSSPESWLFVKEINGNVVEIPFAGSQMVMSDGMITIQTPLRQYNFPFDEVNHFFFRRSGTAIEKIAVSDLRVTLDDAHNLRILSNSPLGEIAIYSLTGTLLKREKTGSPDISIPIVGLARGVYLVKALGKTVKIVR